MAAIREGYDDWIIGDAHVEDGRTIINGNEVSSCASVGVRQDTVAYLLKVNRGYRGSNSLLELWLVRSSPIKMSFSLECWLGRWLLL